MGQDKGGRVTGESSDLSALLEEGVVDATAGALLVLIPSGQRLTCQVQWTLMRVLSGEEKEVQTVTHMHGLEQRGLIEQQVKGRTVH